MTGRKVSKSAKDDGHVSNGGQPRVAFKGYLNFTPTAADKTALRDFLASGGQPLDWLVNVLSNGYRMSVSLDTYHAAFSASLYDTDSQRNTAGWNLAQRADDPYSAITRLLFVHVELLEGNWLSLVDARPKTDVWGE